MSTDLFWIDRLVQFSIVGNMATNRGAGLIAGLALLYIPCGGGGGLPVVFKLICEVVEEIDIGPVGLYVSIHVRPCGRI